MPVSNCYKNCQGLYFPAQKMYDFLKPSASCGIMKQVIPDFAVSHLQGCPSFPGRQSKYSFGDSLWHFSRTCSKYSSNDLTELLLDLKKVSVFQFFLPWAAKGSLFVQHIRSAVITKKAGKLFVSRVSDTYRNSDFFPSLCVFDFIFEESGILQVKRTEKGEACSTVVWLLHLQYAFGTNVTEAIASAATGAACKTALRQKTFTQCSSLTQTSPGVRVLNCHKNF